jgi:hypothetical protein
MMHQLLKIFTANPSDFTYSTPVAAYGNRGIEESFGLGWLS